MNIPKMKCLNCNKEFDRFHTAMKFCSVECREKHYSSIHFPPKNYPERECKICGKKFKPRINQQLNCSRECKEKWKNSSRRKDSERFLLIANIGECESCGFSNKLGLVLHHIKGRENNEGMVLCGSCHTIFHRLTGKDYFSENSTKEEVLKILS